MPYEAMRCCYPGRFLIEFAAISYSQADQDAPRMVGDDAMPRFDQPLTVQQSAAFSRLALDCIVTEYPNKPSQVMVGDESALAPRQLHPVFYGCFDWHSVARALPAGDLRAQVLLESAGEHLAAGLDYVFSGHYEGGALAGDLCDLRLD